MRKELKQQQEVYSKYEVQRLREEIERGYPKLRSKPYPEVMLSYKEYEQDDPKHRLWITGWLGMANILRDLKDPYDTPIWTIKKRIVLKALTGVFLRESYMSYDGYCTMIEILLYGREFDYGAFDPVQEELFRCWKVLGNVYNAIHRDLKNETEEFFEKYEHDLRVRLHEVLGIVLLKEKYIKKEDYFDVLEQLY